MSQLSLANLLLPFRILAPSILWISAVDHYVHKSVNPLLMVCACGLPYLFVACIIIECGGKWMLKCCLVLIIFYNPRSSHHVHGSLYSLLPKFSTKQSKQLLELLLVRRIQKYDNNQVLPLPSLYDPRLPGGRGPKGGYAGMLLPLPAIHAS